MKIICHVANYQGDFKNGIDVVVDNIVKHSRFENAIYSLCKSSESTISFFQLVKTIVSNKNCHVVFHTMYNIKSVLLALLCLTFNAKYSVFPHSSSSCSSQTKSKKKKKIFRALILNRVLSNASYINFLNKEELNNSFIPIEYPFLKLEVVGNGVDLPICNVAKENKIVFLGRYDVHHKGIDTLLASILSSKEIALSFGFKFELRGVSHSPEDDRFISDYIKDNNMNDFVFVGGSIVGDKEKSKFLSSAKFYVLTSRYEGLPITVLESLACGTPVIVSNATNTGSMVENNMLGFVAEDDVVSISNRISEAIKTSEDEYLNLSTRASKYALDNLSWKLIVEKHDINYEKY
jgi:glycosyltransferase involved in cell wall biosynthesis